MPITVTLPADHDPYWGPPLSQAIQAIADGASQVVNVSVREFGAVGDGVTDDYAAIAAAIASIPTASSGILFFPPGVYLTSVAIDLPYYITVQGAGMYTTRVLTTSTTANVFTASGKSLITIRDIGVGSSVNQSAGAAFRFTTCVDVKLQDVTVWNSYQLGYFTGTNQITMDKIRVMGPSWTDKGFYFVTCIDVHLHNLLVNGGTTQLAAGEAWVTVDSNCDTFELTSSAFVASSGAGTCLIFKNSVGGGFAPRWVRLTNVWCEGGSAAVAHAAWAEAITINDVNNFKMIGGYVSTSLHGIEVVAGKDISFIGTNIQACAYYGFAVFSTNAPTGLQFIDCTFSDNSQEANLGTPHAFIGGNVVGAKFIGCYFGDRLIGYTNKCSSALETYTSDLIWYGNESNTAAVFAGTGRPREGFFGATKVSKPAAYTQTYATATRTHSNPTAVAMATTAATQTTPWGFTTQAQANAHNTTINQLIVDVANLKQLVNSMIDDGQTLGLLQ